MISGLYASPASVSVQPSATAACDNTSEKMSRA